MNSYGYKDKINYSAFINLIFPVDVKILKEISVTGVKKYLGCKGVCEEVLVGFCLLVKEEIAMIEGLSALKAGLQLRLVRKDVKNIMKLMKRSSSKSQMEI